jgi:hypothetical protein
LVLPALQVPPPHVDGAVCVPAEHDPAAPQGVPGATCSQLPAPSQLPSLPQLAAAHWPVGAARPAVMLAQVPSATPVSAWVHAWQVLPQAVLQQMPETQFPLAHCVLAVHAMPSVPVPVVVVVLVEVVVVVVPPVPVVVVVVPVVVVVVVSVVVVVPVEVVVVVVPPVPVVVSVEVVVVVVPPVPVVVPVEVVVVVPPVPVVVPVEVVVPAPAPASMRRLRSTLVMISHPPRVPRVPRVTARSAVAASRRARVVMGVSFSGRGRDGGRS